MKGRKRRILGFTIIGVAGLLLGVVAISPWRMFNLQGQAGGRRFQVGVFSGMIGIQTNAADVLRPWEFGFTPNPAPKFAFLPKETVAYAERLRQIGVDCTVIPRISLVYSVKKPVPVGSGVLQGEWGTIMTGWPVPFVVAVPGVALWMLGRRAGKRDRAARGFCFRCGYDRKSIAAGLPCPECGATGHAAPA